jgi:glycosyltransferase involved in cell wall biosynthesis
MKGVPSHVGAAGPAGTPGHSEPDEESATLRVLHLGFEDPLMPGAGGGSTRTREINRRLAADGCQVTVLTTRYPGCADGLREGVRYEHVGIGQGGTRLTRLLGYVAALPAAVWASPDADLVVEDFLPPFSSMAVPLWTRRPVVGMVQWLHAREKSRQYRLPFHLVERAAVRTHRRLIAVSQGTAERLREMNPGVHIDVIGNGVDPALFEEAPQLGRDVLCIGRLELGGKGIDLLLQAWAQVCDRIRGDLVVAGTGPDEARVRQLAARLAIAERVRFMGWVGGAEKARLLSGSRLVVVPSRAETFGMVAVEALAAATPVVAFDIPCLREVVPPDCGRLVAAFDVGALGTAMLDLYGHEAFLLSAGERARAFASAYDWDRLAADQARAYRAAASQGVHAHPHPVRRSDGRR